MGYGTLGHSEPEAGAGASDISEPPHAARSSSRRKLTVLSLLSLALIIIASVVFATLLVGLRTRASGGGSGPRIHSKTSLAISKTCSKTRFPSLCVNSLLDFPGVLSVSEQDLVHISFNITLHYFNRALYQTSTISFVQMDTRVRSAYEDCIELLDDSVDALSRSLLSVAQGGNVAGSKNDVITWLSAALTNHDTCMDGFEGVSGYVKNQVYSRLKDLGELVSNCLVIFSESVSDDIVGMPTQNRRRLMEKISPENEGAFPRWLGRKERKLLNMPISEIRADIIVSKEGNGTCKTVAEAIRKAPQYSNRRTIIYVMAGRYEEDNLKVGRKKTNLMFIGDGKGKTIITGGKSVLGHNITTFHTSAFAATGTGFIARDMTFENYAGPSKHQAVALRVGSDHAVVYRCNIIGYQDTLYVHSNRQFFRECDIYGTVDFIFGNAAVVLQNCSIYARKPMDLQKNTITAQNRKDPNQNTGISIHASRVLAAPDLVASNGTFQTYLGRPWKMYSMTVYMLSHIGEHVHPRGWLEWNATFALDTLYYGEYKNFGPGAALGERVKWPGYRVITSPVEASRFTVGQFIYGSSWLPSTGVAFFAGLEV